MEVKHTETHIKLNAQVTLKKVLCISLCGNCSTCKAQWDPGMFTAFVGQIDKLLGEISDLVISFIKRDFLGFSESLQIIAHLQSAMKE